MKTPACNFRRALTLAGLAAGLLFGGPSSARAAADVTQGEMVLPASFPIATLPGDPDVALLADDRLEACFVTDAGGGLHILIKELKELFNATVTGTSFDYDFVALETPNPSASANNLNPKGHYWRPRRPQ